MNDLEKMTEICQKYGNNEYIEKAVKEAFMYKEKEFEKYHKPLYEVTDYKNYKRHLIQLRPDTAILIHMFKREADDNFESIWLGDNENYYAADHECIKDSAHQLLQQLEGRWCDLFIEALRDECNEILKHSEEEKNKFKNKCQ